MKSKGLKLGRVAERISELQKSSDLLDISRNIARYSMFLEQTEDRLEEHDSPHFRRTILNMIHDGDDIKKIEKYVTRAVEEDRQWMILLSYAEKQANMQTRAAEIMMRGDSSLTAKQVVAIFSSFLKILSSELPKDVSRKVLNRIWKEVFCQDPRIGISEAPALVVESREEEVENSK